MRTVFAAALAALAAQEVAGHATFQQLWVDGTDYISHGSTCVRLPASNSPLTDVTSSDFACNIGGRRGVGGKCPVKAGGVVTIEMHQQPNDRNCRSEAIGGMHWGPVQVYLSKVPDASTAEPTQVGWFKIFSNAWAKKPGGNSGDDDYWGTRELNGCCGRMDVPIPTDLEDGDYLLRAEALALHAMPGQFYMSCYQITITGGTGTAKPATVRFPGAYTNNDAGIRANIHAPLSTYIAPGPEVYSGGTTRAPGEGCPGCATTCQVGSSPSAQAPGHGTAVGGGAGGPSACTVQAYGQCGGQGYTGCTECADGFVCREVSAPWYSQCQPGF
ncbi:hypothetical protein VTJ04DRAFT_2243 [Mycothermus thermophilus]|uniref:uncharacterized protein n=1 Tax=Humicola insolens TaxID=85995 RepID=UPI00042D7EAF